MKRYIKTNTGSVMIPDGLNKYYKIDKSSDEDLEELADEFAYYNLEFMFPIVAKSRYFDIFDVADICYASVCRRTDGSIGVYVLAGDSAHDISDPDKIEDIIRRVRRDQRR